MTLCYEILLETQGFLLHVNLMFPGIGNSYCFHRQSIVMFPRIGNSLCFMLFPQTKHCKAKHCLCVSWCVFSGELDTITIIIAIASFITRHALNSLKRIE